MWHNHLSFDYPPQAEFLLLLALLLSAFFLGHILTGIVVRLSGGTLPYWFQDVQAWVALLALVALGILLIVQLFINPSLAEPERLNLQKLEAGLAALVGFYFGARS